jgi:hypothetical protein
MTMEFLDGQPLHRVVREFDASPKAEHEHELPLAMRLRIVTEVLEGLHYAHELRDYDGSPMKVVHRDVSPQNVFLTYFGQIKLVDFGIAKASDSVTHTEGRGLKGKLAYMSPQQAGNEALDRRADLFAAGVILWELLAGRRLWAGCNEATIARRLVEHDLPDLALPDVPAPLLEICRRALAPAVDDRYATAAEFCRDLELFMDAAGLDASPRTIGKRVSAVFRKQREQVRARIDRELCEIVGGESSSIPALTLWREPYRGEHTDRTLDSDVEHLSTPEEVTADYGPKLGEDDPPLGGKTPAPSGPPREASGLIDTRAAMLAEPGRRRPSWWAVVAGVALAAALVAPVVHSQLRAPGHRSAVEPTPVEPPSLAGCDALDKARIRLSGEIDADATLTCDRDYLLEFTTRIAPDVTLTIEPGTTIYGDRETKGTLLVQPGARLIAAGTRERPIVFTSEQPEGERKPGDWGGVIVLGRAPINLRSADGRPIRGQVEGVAAAARYGGEDPDDDSGVLRYVRIEYPGSELAPANEINGLTLAGVGRKTVIDHVQVRASSDDCFEFLGGTVDAKHLVCDTPGDDALDFDHGYQGRIQFVVVRDRNHEQLGYGPDRKTSHAFEIDNDPNGTTATPRTRPQVWNVTACGTTGANGPSYAILVRRAALAELGGLVLSGFDYALDLRDNHTDLELHGVALLDQPHAEIDERDDDSNFDEAAWLAAPERARLLDVSGFDGCEGPMPASILPRAPLVPVGFAGPPDDGFFDGRARYLGAFAGPSDDWTAGWVVWTD